MEILFSQLNNTPCKTYIFARGGQNEVVLVDPLLKSVDNYIEYLVNNDLKLGWVIDTHTHADHVSAGAHLAELTNCHYMMHENAPQKAVTTHITHNMEMLLARIPVKFIHTPGHTRDSICIILPGIILTGDTLFLEEGGAGRSDLAGGSSKDLFNSLQQIKKLPEGLMVYPGHDYRNRMPSHLSVQKNLNPFLKYDNENDFVDFLSKLHLGPADWMEVVLEANIKCETTLDNVDMGTIESTPACEVMGTLNVDQLSNKENSDNGFEEVTQKADEVKFISILKLKDNLSQGSMPILLDVREENELTDEFGHIPGIKNIPIGYLEKRLDELDGKEDKEIIVICRTQNRSYAAAHILKNNYFTDVKVLKGGMVEWNKQKS